MKRIAQTLLRFVPGLAAVAAAGVWVHPLTTIPLLLANALTMAAICHAIDFGPEQRYGQTVLRRGAAYLVMFTCYTALVFALIAWPMLRLSEAPTLGAALLLAAALVIALGALWRPWPAFGLVFVWDDAHPPREDGSRLFTAIARSLAFARHLSREDRFFTHFLPAAFALLVLAFGVITLPGLYGILPPELRIAALAIYGAVVMPLGCLVLANRTLRVLLCEQHRPERAPLDGERTAATPQAVSLTEAERASGTPAQAAALLAATRTGDIERALALIEAGADPDTAPTADDRDQRPVLTLAALLPDTRLLRALIAHGAAVDRASGGVTALLAATRDSWHGRAEAVMTLLANGASPLVTDAHGSTPLHGAVLSGEPIVAAMLLDAAAPVNALDREGLSPLGAACRAANWTLARFLLEHGAKANLPGSEPALLAAAGIAEDDPEGVKLLLKHRAPVNTTDAHGRTALMIAAAEGHLEIVRTLRAAGADVAPADQRGCTALMEASRSGSHALVTLLAEARPEAGARDEHGRDALTLACQSPHAQVDTVRGLLELGADPRVPGNDGRSALDHAAAAGRWDLVTAMDPETPLPTTLDLDALAEGADTPAHLLDALRFGHWAVVSTFTERVRHWPPSVLAQLYLDLASPDLTAARRWLLARGLDPEVRLPPPAEPGNEPETPSPTIGPRLFDALLQALPDTSMAVRELLQAGASPAGAGLLAGALARVPGTDADTALVNELIDRGADPFGPDPRGRTPLHLAAANNHASVLERLLQCGCNPNARDLHGRTPLFAALENGPAATVLVRTLVAYGADAEAADAQGETPLGLALEHPALGHWLDWGHWPRPLRPLRAEDLPVAARSGASVAVARLLELGFAVDTPDRQGATALLHACGAGQQDVATQLLDAGANPTLAASNGVTPLAAATGARRDTLVALLLARGVPVDQRLVGDTSALMIAAAMGHSELVERLLDAGADIHAIDTRGRTALHAAAQFGFEHNDSLRARRLFDALLRHGADVNRADREGKTPLLMLLGAHVKPGSTCDPTHIGALVPVLLEAGAALAHADQRGVTPLHACAMHALLAPARILLARGADRGSQDGFGRTAADVARQLGLVDIAHELATRGHAMPSVRQTLRQPAQPTE